MDLPFRGIILAIVLIAILIIFAFYALDVSKGSAEKITGGLDKGFDIGNLQIQCDETNSYIKSDTEPDNNMITNKIYKVESYIELPIIEDNQKRQLKISGSYFSDVNIEISYNNISFWDKIRY